MVERAAMISGTTIASALADCWEERVTIHPHTQPALKGEK